MKTIFTSLALLLCASLFAQPGSLDPGFGTNGIYKGTDTINGKDGEIHALKVLSNGKIIMAGTSNVPRVYAPGDLSVFRLNANGTLDSSFGTKGKTVIDFATDSDRVGTNEITANLFIQPDGKIVVSCTILLYPQSDGPDANGIYNYSHIGVVRLNADGILDNTFNGTGKKRINLVSYVKHSNINRETCVGVAVRANGKIVLGGSFANVTDATSFLSDADALMIQLNANGSFDNSFGDKGVRIFPKTGTDENINSIALQTDGKLVLAGNVDTARKSTTANVLVMRATASGILDKNFNQTGYTTTDIQKGSADDGKNVVIQSNGKIVVSANITPLNGSTVQSFLLRYNANGKPDNTFGTKGKAFVDSSSLAFANTSLSLAPDQKIIQTNSRFWVYRLNTNGSRDASFGINGKVIVNPDTYNFTWVSGASGVQPDSKIVVGGYTNFSLGRIGSGYTELAVRLLGSSPSSANRADDQLITNKIPAVSSGDMNVAVYNNPSRNQFTVRVATSDAANSISLRISDASGRLMEVITGIRNGETEQFGVNYQRGTYYAECIQGNQHKTVKLVKL